MTGNDLPPDDDLAGDLRDLARAEQADAPSIDGLRARIGASVPGFVPPDVPPTPPSEGERAGGGSGLVGSGKALFAAGGIVVGALLGAFVMHTIDRENPTIRVVEVPVAAPSIVLPPATTNAPGPPPSAPELPSPTAAPAPPIVHPSASSGSSSSAERHVIDDARGAYARGELAPALDALAMHAKSYPNGTLVEEREALAVRILVDANRHGEARVRGERFRARYPKSLMLPAVEAALASIP